MGTSLPSRPTDDQPEQATPVADLIKAEIANVDSTTNRELIVGFIRGNYNTAAQVILDVYRYEPELSPPVSPLMETFAAPVSFNNWSNFTGHPDRLFLTLQLDRVRAKELLLFDGTVRRPSQDPTGKWRMEELLSLPVGASLLVVENHASIAAANVDYDGGDFQIDEVIVHEGSGIRILKITPPAEEGQPYTYRMLMEANMPPPASPPPAHALLVPADVDHDGIYGRYTHRTTFLSDNHMIAVLAAPPCAEGIGQDLDACESTLAYRRSQGWTHTVTLSIWESVGIGFDIETQASAGVVANAGTTIGELEEALMATATLSFEYSKSRIVTTSIGFVAGPEDHQVVFSTIPYDRYYYDAIAHFDPELVGKSFYVAVPYEAQIYSMTRSYYEAIRGDQLPIDSTILSSTPGVLASYPREEDWEQYRVGKDILFDVQSLTVGQGAPVFAEGVISSTHSFSLSLSVELEGSMKECITWLCLYTAVGVGVAYAATYEFGNEVAFTAQLGGLDAATWADKKYTFTLVGHRVKESYEEHPNRPTTQDFLVLDFLVTPP